MSEQQPPLSPVAQPSPFGSPSDPLISANYNDWLRRNANLVKAYWRPLLVLNAIAAAVGLVVKVPTAIGQAIALRGVATGRAATPSEALRALTKSLPALGIGELGSIIASLVLALVLIAGMRLLVVAVTGGPASVGDGLRGALPRLLPVVGWGLLAGLITLVGFCACVLPGIYLSAVFLVLPAVVLFERGGIISRCFKLFHGDFGSAIARVATVVAVVIVATLISGVVSGIVAAVAGAAAPGTGGLVTGTVLSTIFSTIVVGALGVVLTPLLLTTYADERARIEPLHTGVLAHELATA